MYTTRQAAAPQFAGERHPIGALRVRRARVPPYGAEVGADLREVSSSMAAKFELYTDESGVHRFRLKASTGAVIITSDPHETREQCLKSIETIRKAAPYAQVAEVRAGAPA
ncbi:YegP family protein [Kitasatospora sp. NPDC096147]|uniref:YegP family protein n=1 Tax=Kitasatospora sp. NPDC096147 TaxID=3364093 RepID=UPI0038135121